MATNPKLVHLAIGVIAQLTGYAPTREAAAMRLQRVLADGADFAPYVDPPRHRSTAPTLGEIAWIDAYGHLRRGIVIKVTPQKCLVAYVVPSNLTDIKVANVTHRRAIQEGPKT